MKRPLLIIGLLFMLSCAQQVAPTGGPKDETPPKILFEDPANLSTDFNGKQIEIAFDEFIKLYAVSDQVIISPPLLRSPSYQLKKKSLVVKFEQELAPNTTYTINFGEAIRDNNEGNILSNYTYVFSTGAYLDSMQVKGQLTDVLTNEPEPGALVMLYRKDIDSLPLDTIPDYFTRTDENGLYGIEHVADQPYKIFALKDENANYRFDVPTEKIGFLDSLIIPQSLPTQMIQDTTAMDTLSLPNEETLAAIPSYDLAMFVEDDTTQYLKKAYCDHFGKLVFIYNLPVKNFSLSLMNFSSKKQWQLEDRSPTQDSVTVWITDVVPDTMNLLVSVGAASADTVALVMKELGETTSSPVGSGKGKMRGRVTETFSLTVSSVPGPNRSPKPDAPFTLIWNHPILGLDISKMKLYEDSVRVTYDITTNDRALRRFDIHYPWKSGKMYRLMILDSAFRDMYDLWNDTVEFSFAGTDKDMFGSLSLKVLKNPKTQVVVELLEASGKLVERRSIGTLGTFKFEELDPGTYSINVIEDLNGNGRWDSGRYAEKLQPEPIRTIQSGAEVRANWEFELEWNPND